MDSRDRRISTLEGETEELRRVNNLAYLIFEGPGVPSAPKDEPWKEDVAKTTKDLLTKNMPSVPVSDGDIRQCYRAGRGKQIVCEFTRCGSGSVRDAVYEARMTLMKDENGQRRGASDQVFCNEKLTTGAAEANRKLHAAKKSGKLHSVHTKHGFIYVRMFQHGAKIRVSSRVECERVLRGEC